MASVIKAAAVWHHL